MKNTLLFIFIISFQFFVAQTKSVKKPEFIKIINQEIVSDEKLKEYEEAGKIESVRMGVTEEERIELFKKYGEKIGEKEFIIKIILRSKENEKLVENSPANTSTKATRTTKLKTNQTAPDFTVEILNGTPINLSDLKGKVVLVNFWATWCAPCLMELHEIPSKIIEPFKDSPFVFLAISSGESKEKVTNKINSLKNKGVNFTTGIDPDKIIWDKYESSSIPANYLIDKNGIIRYISLGNAEGNLDKLTEEIKKLLN